jgi:8-oxo-dGTP diphosphatase
VTGRPARPRPDRARPRPEQARPRPDQEWPGAEIRAAGAVLYRHGEHGTEVAVIHRPGHDDWSFPKGKLEPGEHVLLAAVREVTEETGVRPVLGRPLATVRYLVEGRPKRVDYWAGRASGAGQQAAFVPGDEVDRLDWLPVPAVSSRLTYGHDARLLERLLVPAADGCPPGPDTVPYVLLRHASAGRKSAWHGDDLLRPLDERGEADAAALARLLACYGVQRVISSAAERCLGTVRPYAERIGAPIEADPAFTVRARDGDRGDAARRRVAELLAHPVPTVICGHRENLPVLYAQARGVLRCSPPDDGWSPPKAGFWVLHTAGNCLSAVEHHSLSS